MTDANPHADAKSRRDPEELIAEAKERWSPIKTYCLFSGGGDSDPTGGEQAAGEARAADRARVGEVLQPAHRLDGG